MMTFAKPSPRKAVCLSGRASAGHGSGHSDAAFTTQQPHRSPPIHRPADRNNASPPTCIDILTAQSTLAADLSCGPPTPKSPSKRAGTAQYVTFLAVSSLEGFQTPAAVRVGMFVTAGVWKPSQDRTRGWQSNDCPHKLFTEPCFEPIAPALQIAFVHLSGRHVDHLGKSHRR